MILFFFIIFSLLFLYGIKLTKRDLANYYGVCIKTLNKWILYFCPKINSEKWKQKRKPHPLQITYILDTLGTPSENKSLSKSDILEEVAAKYHKVPRNIFTRNIEKCIEVRENYLNIDIFPPNVSKYIVDRLNGKRSTRYFCMQSAFMVK